MDLILKLWCKLSQQEMDSAIFSRLKSLCYGFIDE